LDYLTPSVDKTVEELADWGAANIKTTEPDESQAAGLSRPAPQFAGQIGLDR
jgi:hypothetical protein